MAARLWQEKKAMVLVQDKQGQLKLIYQWIKQDAITLAEFRELFDLITEE